MSANNIGLGLHEISSPSIQQNGMGIHSVPGSRFEQVRHSFQA